MKQFLFGFIALISTTINAQLKSPADYLPNYGAHVTYYHELENYFQHLKNNSEGRLTHIVYGKTYEGRNLNAYIISTPDNTNNLENIRQSHLYQIGLLKDKPAGVTDKAIIWLSFNVHGNEPAAAESAMKIAYELVKPDNLKAKEWLKDIIVVLDPCLNPDGFSRYGNWLHSITGKNPHTALSDREHMEPWPGGRENHYAYDLNRDWAWQVQAETQQRMELYNQWMPMVHVDVHEMGFNEPYFFPPPAEPMHEYITKSQKEFYDAIGEMTAKRFDANGWSYYTREVFDLFYPSYGDTYPSFNGAVGMTYEQGGIGAGRAVERINGSILTLQDRIDHHTAAVLTAVETAAWQKDKLVKNFRAYFTKGNENLKGSYTTYIVKHNGSSAELAQLLTKNKIEFSYADETKKMFGYHYQSNAERDFELQPNDLIIKVNQPKAVLTQVLFEPHQKLNDSLSYDITAWSLPLAYGSNSYALKKGTAIKTRNSPVYKGKFEYDRVYAYYIPWNGRNSARILSQLHQNNIKVRTSLKSSLYRGIKVSPGDLVVLKSDNIDMAEFTASLNVLLDEKPDYEVIESGFAISGSDLGGESFALLRAPKVLLLSGNGVNSTDFGQAWFYMDEIVDYPVSIVDLQNVSRVKFEDFTTIILADGFYNLSETDRSRIDAFVSNGGKIIAIGGALKLFEDRQGYSLTHFAIDANRENNKQQQDDEKLTARYYNYESFVRRGVSSSVSGAIIENVIDKTHPLSFGLGNSYFSLKTSDEHYELLKNVQNVVYVPKDYLSFGFIGNSLKDKLVNTVTFAVEEKGKGQIIYMVDNPLFRGFWENGNLLFSNALFLVH